MLLTGRLLLLSIFITSIAVAQPRPIQLHLKKHGKVKKRIEIGTVVTLEDKEGVNYGGTITFMYNDTLVLNSEAFIPVEWIRKIKLEHESRVPHIPLETFGWITLGVVLTTVGLGATGLESWRAAAITALAIGYTPLVFMLIKSISFKKYSYRIGKKFTLRVWDLN